MRNPPKVSYFVTGTATFALLAGCSSGGSGVTAPVAGGGVTQQGVARAITAIKTRSYSVLRPGIAIRPRVAGAVKPFVNSGALAKTTNTVAMSDYVNDVIDIFDSKGNLDAMLSGGFEGPQGMTSDIKGDLFIADTGNSRIVKYAAGFKGTPTSISDPNQYPAGVDSFSNGKWLAVTNLLTTSGGPGSVTIYKDSKIIGTVTSSNLLQAYFCAFDASGNLFVSGFDANGLGSVGEIPNATSGGKLTYAELKVNNVIAFPGNVQVTTTGSIVIGDQSVGKMTSSLYTYNPPKNGSLGTPSTITPLDGSADAVTFAFTKDMSSFYAADAGLLEGLEYSYPTGGSALSTFAIPNGGAPVGTAIIPTQWPKVQNLSEPPTSSFYF